MKKGTMSPTMMIPVLGKIILNLLNVHVNLKSKTLLHLNKSC